MVEFNLKPIGVVRNKHDLETMPEDWDDVVSEITIYKRYQKGLFQLEQYKKILVIFWFHKERSTKLRLHPRGDVSRPIRGVFATRGRMRPNKLGVTEVELLGVKDNVIRVRGLDAVNGTPIIDIKSTDERARKK